MGVACSRPSKNEASLEPADQQSRTVDKAGVVSMPLTYKTLDSTGTTVHTPMFERKIGSERQLFIVDTGATDSIFAKRLAGALGLTLRDDDPGTDHAGAPVPTWIATPDLEMHLGPHRVVFSPTMVIDAPPPFADWGIGGIVSPQNLHPNAVLVLDLIANELVLHEQPLDTVLDTLSERLRRPPLRLPRDTTTPDTSKLVVVRGETSDGAPLRILLNTGGRRVEIDPAACDAAIGEQTQVRGKGVSGADVVGAVLAEQTVALGERRFTYEQVTVRPQGASYDAQLGIGALRDTVIVVSGDRRAPAYWWPKN